MARPRGGTAAVAAACLAAAAIATPLAQRWEGYRGRAYYDPAHILTQCYGETRHVDPARIYSRDECAAQLRQRLARDYAPRVIACVPALLDRHAPFAALLDAAYNAGPGAVCASPMARAFNAGQWAQGCEAFAASYRLEGLLVHGWFASASMRDPKVSAAWLRSHGWTRIDKTWRKEMPGLVARRKDERKVCLEGVRP